MFGLCTLCSTLQRRGSCPDAGDCGGAHSSGAAIFVTLIHLGFFYLFIYFFAGFSLIGLEPLEGTPE